MRGRGILATSLKKFFDHKKFFFYSKQPDFQIMKFMTYNMGQDMRFFARRDIKKHSK